MEIKFRVQNVSRNPQFSSVNYGDYLNLCDVTSESSAFRVIISYKLNLVVHFWSLNGNTNVL